MPAEKTPSAPAGAGRVTPRMILRCSRQEIGIIRAALSAHREKLEPAIRLASRAKDTEHLTTLMGERKATTQMIQELDRKDHPSASITSIDA